MAIDNKALSPYAKFHLEFIGYRFQEIMTGKVYTKGEFWDEFRHTAINMAETRRVPMTIRLIDSPGWKDGQLIKAPEFEL
jgi:hypothetical protein